MSKYEIYQMGKLPPLTVIKADDFEVDYDKHRLKFVKDHCIIAIFNFDNIAGFRNVEE